MFNTVNLDEYKAGFSLLLVGTANSGKTSLAFQITASDDVNSVLYVTTAPEAGGIESARGRTHGKRVAVLDNIGGERIKGFESLAKVAQNIVPHPDGKGRFLLDGVKYDAMIVDSVSGGASESLEEASEKGKNGGLPTLRDYGELGGHFRLFQNRLNRLGANYILTAVTDIDPALGESLALTRSVRAVIQPAVSFIFHLTKPQGKSVRRMYFDDTTSPNLVTKSRGFEKWLQQEATKIIGNDDLRGFYPIMDYDDHRYEPIVAKLFDAYIAQV